MLDSVAYFSQKYWVYDGVFKNGDPTSQVAALMEMRETNYGDSLHQGGLGLYPGELLVNFMDNHDVPRFLYELPDPAALRGALTYLFTQDGIPTLYYGTEQELAGGNDPANREPMWWSGYDTSGETFQHVAALTRLRKAYAPLRRGETRLTWTHEGGGDDESPGAGVLAFERDDGVDAVLVAINTRDTDAARTGDDGGDMAVGFAPGTTLLQVFPPGGDAAYTVAGDGTVSVALGPREAVVLAPADAVVAY